VAGVPIRRKELRGRKWYKPEEVEKRQKGVSTKKTRGKPLKWGTFPLEPGAEGHEKKDLKTPRETNVHRKVTKPT